MNKLLIIMARSPELGKVKSRLAKTLGENRALDIYKKLLHHTLTCAKSSGVEIKWFVDGDTSYFQDLGLNIEKQSNGDLGNKMKDAFAHSFSKEYDQVVMIGTDCIDLSSSTIHDAFQALSKCDVVLGPAQDGGYYLIGMKKMLGELFESMPWSTEFLLAKTIERTRLLSLSITTLTIKNDIDEEKDLEGTNL
jgi:uncharacterized protein